MKQSLHDAGLPPGAFSELLSALERAMPGAVSAALEDRICYSYDATDIRSLPDVVLWPRKTSEVVAAVCLTGERGVPLVPRGAGTGYTGGSIPVSGGVVLSFEKMSRILLVDARRRLAVVEPGVVNDELRSEVAPLGLTYPPDPASLRVSTIGGNVAEGAGGPRTVLYGTTRDYVVGLEAVLPDGNVVATGVLSTPRAAGWDAGPLVVGSEGTLAVITKIAVRLTEVTEEYATYWAEFSSLEGAATAVSQIAVSGLPVGVLELLDRETYACAVEYVQGHRPTVLPEGALLIELEGKGEDIAGAAGLLRSIAAANGSAALREAASETEREEIWEIRRAISPSLAKVASWKINEDLAVPLSTIPKFVRSMREVSKSIGLPILAFGHAGDGNLHVNIMLERGNRPQMLAARRGVDALFSEALAMGGTLSGEHGIGVTKAEHLTKELDGVAVALSIQVKSGFDRTGFLNPHKIITHRANPWWEDLPPEPERGEPGPC